MLEDPLRHIRPGSVEYRRATKLGTRMFDVGHTDLGALECLGMVLAAAIAAGYNHLGKAWVEFGHNQPWGQPDCGPLHAMSLERTERRARSVTACHLPGAPFSFATHGQHVIDVLTGQAPSGRLKHAYHGWDDGRPLHRALELPKVGRVVYWFGDGEPGRSTRVVLGNLWSRADFVDVAIETATEPDDSGWLTATGSVDGVQVTVELDQLIRCGRLRRAAASL